jgi:hypothetical protein
MLVGGQFEGCAGTMEHCGLELLETFRSDKFKQRTMGLYREPVDHERQYDPLVRDKVYHGQVLLSEIIVLPHVSAGYRMVEPCEDSGEPAGMGTCGGTSAAGQRALTIVD